MKERPIIFSAPMVRAILAGQKTQTRRAIKPQPPPREDGSQNIYKHADGWRYSDCEYGLGVVEKCPYGVPGDRLWVRETWAHCQPILDIKKPDGRLITEISDGYAEYKADGFDSIQDLKEHVRLVAGHEIIVNGDKWKPSIFMPRWASRITLEVTGIRVERVQDISEKDAREEGVSQKTLRLKSITSGTWADIPCYKAGFKDLWDSINGKKCPWASNPWVWVIGFRRIGDNGDPINELLDEGV